ncbi:MAG: hypothetical protein NVSMB52_06930 [Chloroflexota bacterium]
MHGPSEFDASLNSIFCKTMYNPGYAFDSNVGQIQAFSLGQCGPSLPAPLK